MGTHILIIEDEEHLRSYTKKILQREGYQVSEADSGKTGLAQLRKNVYDLLLIDLNLGDIDGREIIRILRRQNNETPVIVVSNFEQIDTKVNAFDVGCDDYITKPFYKEELLARVKRMCERQNSFISDHPETVQQEVQAGPFRVDYRKGIVYKNEKELVLSNKLFELFNYFFSNRNRILTKDQILDRIWGDQEDTGDNTLSVHIHMLREQVEDNPGKPVHLITKRSRGYIFEISG